jgi:cystathionine beta-lyase/cystathionine gamma-synthase
VLFPFDENFPQYQLARNQMKDACGLISFFIRAGSRAEIVKFCENLKHIMMAVSWGGHESHFCRAAPELGMLILIAGNPDHRMLRIYRPRIC